MIPGYKSGVLPIKLIALIGAPGRGRTYASSVYETAALTNLATSAKLSVFPDCHLFDVLRLKR